MNINVGVAVFWLLSTSVVWAKLDCRWLGTVGSKPYQTSADVAKYCDDKSFKELNYYLAKDSKAVYCKPMPNAHSYAIVIPGADASSIQLVNNEYLAKDKKCIYKYCSVVDGLEAKTFDLKRDILKVTHGKLVDTCK